MKTSDGVCSEPFWPSSLEHGVLSCFRRVSVSWSTHVGKMLLALVHSNIVFMGDGAV